MQITIRCRATSQQSASKHNNASAQTPSVRVLTPFGDLLRSLEAIDAPNAAAADHRDLHHHNVAVLRLCEHLPVHPYDHIVSMYDLLGCCNRLFGRQIAKKWKFQEMYNGICLSRSCCHTDTADTFAEGCRQRMNIDFLCNINKKILNKTTTDREKARMRA